VTRRGLGCGLTLLALLTAACGTSGDASNKAGTTLTVISPSPPASLDPAKANVGSDNWFVNLAYDTLIRRGPDGRQVPDLAVKWGYVGAGNKTFEFTLREGVKFADGTPLDAKAVAASLDYARKNGLNVSWTSAIESVTATGPRTVRIQCATPHPALPFLLDNVTMLGSTISQKGLADPGKLGTRSFGAGPYVLDVAQTAFGDHYTYTPNPYYWDKSKIHWKKVVVKVVPNPNSALQAVKTGQGEALAIGSDQVGTARAGGLTIADTPVFFLGVNLADRAGKIVPALKDVRVRQALNYAVDRGAITRALFGEYGKPTTQISLPGLDGFTPDLDARYPYDPQKARQLLAEAGYPNGFSLRMETQAIGPFKLDAATQAVIQQWKGLGIRVDLVSDTTIGQWLGNATSGKFPALGFGYGGNPTYTLSLDWMLPHRTAFNPFASEDPQLTKILAAAAAAPADRQPALYQQAMRWIVDQAWFVSVARMDGIWAFDPKKITGLAAGPGYIPDLAWAVAPK